ncbi:MAG: DUF1800 domain-containing protein [Fimbriimonadaceae bacterium]|nr:DUF1800 domain-containing protein [Fimbriimonadaceae bacterium]
MTPKHRTSEGSEAQDGWAAPSRRAFLRNAVLAGLWAGAATGTAQSNGGRTGPLPVSIKASQRLLWRTNLWPTKADLSRFNALGHDGYLEYQLNPGAIADDACDAFLLQYPTLFQQPHEIYQILSGEARIQLQRACVARAVLTNRQFFERVVEFWTDHFNITNDDVAGLKTIDDRDVIRANALGDFKSLLTASATSPAMIVYLDGNTNVVGRPNENYARELLELHTLGVDGGYTQQDVTEVARCFTGWTIYNSPSDGNLVGTFRYRANRHDNGSKVVLGHPIAAGGGMQDGLTVVDILANHPSTARFVSRKLIRWLLDENPSDALVTSVAAVFTATQGDIKSVIRAILTPGNLPSAPLKYKRPLHYFASVLRALNASVTSVNAVAGSYLGQTGQEPYRWPSPDGYPDRFEYWSGLLLPRWNFSFLLVKGQIAGLSANVNDLGGRMRDGRQIVARLDHNLFHGTLDRVDASRIVEYLRGGRMDANRVQEAFALAVASPQFHWF